MEKKCIHCERFFSSTDFNEYKNKAERWNNEGISLEEKTKMLEAWLVKVKFDLKNEEKRFDKLNNDLVGETDNKLNLIKEKSVLLSSTNYKKSILETKKETLVNKKVTSISVNILSTCVECKLKSTRGLSAFSAFAGNIDITDVILLDIGVLEDKIEQTSLVEQSN
ncbi:MAG: hypothetical protein AM1032_000035 [Mycoplasmataceae bacterium]|nr:MAG: hypothetical protein AM1032_000035 [Mycoplasmataceae bacterium]